MRIRPADDADIDHVATWRLAFLADHRDVEPSELGGAFAAATRAFVDEHQRAGDLRAWLAEDDDGTTVGVVSLLVRPVPPRPDALATNEGYVLNLYVSAHHRRRGIGQLLLDSCLDHARDHRFRRLVLHATEDGRPMYERAGFIRSDRWYELDLS